MGPEPTADLVVRARPAGASTLTLDLDGLARLLLTLSANIPDGSGSILSMASASLGDGRLELIDRGWAPGLALTLASLAEGSPKGFPPQGSGPAAPISPEAAEALARALEARLAAWEDPDPRRAVLNAPVILGEAGLLFGRPSSLAVRWEPGERGFPMGLVERMGGIAAVLAEVSRGPVDWPSLAAKYKYDIIQSLNLSLEVNGRAPVAVYLPGGGL
jgi:hypothetical protein